VGLVPIDVNVPRSPGWWLKREFQLLADRHRAHRLQRLHDYRSGHAPLPEGADNAREAFEAFQKKARANWAELIVSAVSERMMPTGFRTAVDADETGDSEVGDLWQRAGMDVRAADVHDLMLSLSESYAIVGPMDAETGAPRVTKEDPRWCIGEPDPDDPRRLNAGLKVIYDDVEREDRAYLYLPGRMTPTGRTQIWVARRKASLYTPSLIADVGTPRRMPVLDFSERAWDWAPERSGQLPHAAMPMIRFDNKDQLGEYETHTDLIDRINHQVLMRLVIAVLQAHRQKAAKGMPQVYPNGHPKAGQEIDYSDTFTSDPAAFWLLPPGAELWESQPTDLRPILEASKSDIEQLAAVTKTPMHVMMPSGVNQSAEGANLLREQLVFKVEDRISRTGEQWTRLMAVMLLHAGMNDRADLAKLRTMWASPYRLSLAERADAALKAKDDLPRRSRLIHIWGFSPAEADRIMSEWEYDDLVRAQQAAALAAELGTQPGGLNNQPRQPLPGEVVPGGEQPGGPPTIGSQPQSQQLALPAGGAG
jgi:hypothetical protein